MLPILSLGISKSISGNMGMVSGAVGGMMAIQTGSGFLGHYWPDSGGIYHAADCEIYQSP